MNQVKTYVLMALLTILPVWVGSLLGGRNGAIFAFCLDAGAKRIPMQVNPSTAHMLIVKPLKGQGVQSLFSTHPPSKSASGDWRR